MGWIWNVNALNNGVYKHEEVVLAQGFVHAVHSALTLRVSRGHRCMLNESWGASLAQVILCFPATWHHFSGESATSRTYSDSSCNCWVTITVFDSYIKYTTLSCCFLTAALETFMYIHISIVSHASKTCIGLHFHTVFCVITVQQVYEFGTAVQSFALFCLHISICLKKVVILSTPRRTHQRVYRHCCFIA